MVIRRSWFSVKFPAPAGRREMKLKNLIVLGLVSYGVYMLFIKKEEPQQYAPWISGVPVPFAPTNWPQNI
jgi:hypothetical protein